MAERSNIHCFSKLYLECCTMILSWQVGGCLQDFPLNILNVKPAVKCLLAHLQKSSSRISLANVPCLDTPPPNGEWTACGVAA
ncbi:hypothetical protein GDO86_006439 [Hymenochirus boettgeri]|uniref:Uncharacterized protein n=1 Tax=Hymenochirus boettgeri TaxID=247094 RepID=A0A8T2JB33_9PIPI|nr:hypothetical protein GDO86_006439 [Hymenochirus boettgeri]